MDDARDNPAITAPLGVNGGGERFPGRNPDGTWRKGYSPNPSGRPKGMRQFRERNREIAEELAERLAELAQQQEQDRETAETMERLSKAMAQAAAHGGYPTVAALLQAARVRAAFHSQAEFDKFISRVLGEEPPRDVRGVEPIDGTAGESSALDAQEAAQDETDVHTDATTRAAGETTALGEARESQPVPGGAEAGTVGGEYEPDW
jgi:hypothetical protein